MDKDFDASQLVHISQVINSLPSEVDYPSDSFEDWVIDSLTSVSSFFDDLYLLRSFGIISETNLLYRKLNRGDIGSKIWLVSLLLSVRRSITRLYKLLKLKFVLRKQISDITASYSPNLKKLVIEKFIARSDILNSKIYSLLMDLFQDFLYMMIVLIEVFKIKLSKSSRRALE